MPRIPIAQQNKAEQPAVETSSQLQQQIISTTEDVKLKFLESKVVPRDLINNFDSIDHITETTFVYVDNNGTPSKILALNILPKEILWKDLDEDVQQKILESLAKQDQLIPGDHIIIDNANSVISADVGVASINGFVGNVVLRPSDIGAISREDALYNITTLVDDHMLVVYEILNNQISQIVDNKLTPILLNLQQTFNNTTTQLLIDVDNKIDQKFDELRDDLNQNITDQLIAFNLDGGDIDRFFED